MTDLRSIAAMGKEELDEGSTRLSCGLSCVLITRTLQSTCDITTSYCSIYFTKTAVWKFELEAVVNAKTTLKVFLERHGFLHHRQRVMFHLYT